MSEDNRTNARYDDIGKVLVSEICVLPAALDNISSTGCKVCFPVNVVVDLETEYELKITLAKKIGEPPLVLIAQPQWVNEVENNTYVGFKFLYSPDNNRFKDYMKLLEVSTDDSFPDIV